MEETFFAIMIVLAIALAVVLFLLKKNNEKADKKTEKPGTRTTTVVVDETDEGPKPEPEPEVYEDPSRVIRTIVKYEGKRDIWVCPECEAENPASAESCFLCHHVR